jgi:hypothetical protein
MIAVVMTDNINAAGDSDVAISRFRRYARISLPRFPIACTVFN